VRNEYTVPLLFAATGYQHVLGSPEDAGTATRGTGLGDASSGPRPAVRLRWVVSTDADGP
jgi:hypothetical protein